MSASRFFISDDGTITYLVPAAIGVDTRRLHAQTVEVCRVLAALNVAVCGDRFGPCRSITVFNPEDPS